MKLINSVALKQEIANVMPSRTEVFLVIDAMPDAIVQCKDCKNSGLDESGTDKGFWCSAHTEWHDGGYFCADGERRME